MTELKQFLDVNPFSLKTTIFDKPSNSNEGIVIEVADLPKFVDAGDVRSYTTEINIKIFSKREKALEHLDFFTKKFKGEFNYSFFQSFDNETKLNQMNFLTQFFLTETGQR